MSTPEVTLEHYRPNLVGHCYRMLGSAADADDAVQETMVRAWRNFDRFEARAALGTWLYRIATNVCLDALAQRRRRTRPMDLGPAGTCDAELLTLPPAEWIGPLPDAAMLSPKTDPHEAAVLREHTRLAFVAALQYLPPRQRAALLMTTVIGCTAAEVAESLETSVAGVNSALQRARATLAERPTPTVEALDESHADLLRRYVEAFEAFDIGGLTALLRDDATFCMPPFSLWLQGPDEVARWLAGKGSGCRGSRLLPTTACGSAAFAQYRPDPGGGHVPWALIVLEVAEDRIVSWNTFMDTADLFPRFGMPATLPAQ